MLHLIADGELAASQLLKDWRCISVTLFRSAIAFCMIPVNSTVLAIAVVYLGMTGLFNVLNDELGHVHDGQEGEMNDEVKALVHPKPQGANVMNQEVINLIVKVCLFFVAVPMIILGGMAVGSLLGVAIGFAWALYGPGAPEEPFSSKPAGQTRHAISYEEEKRANAVRMEYKGSLVFSREWFEKDKTVLHCQTCCPKRNYKVKGIVIIHHGLHSHAGAVRLTKLSVFLSMQGFRVYTMDGIGHGRSSGPWGVIYSFKEMAQNLAYVAGQIHERHPHLPIFLKGASMGGLLSLYSPFFMNEETLGKLKGIIAVCPAIGVNSQASNKMLEDFTKIVPVHLLKYICPNLPTISGPRGRSFSSDPVLAAEAETEKEEDPLEYKGKMKFATALTFRSTLLDTEARSKLIDELKTLKKPVLLQHGTADKCVSIESSRSFYQVLRSNKKKLIEYAGKSHVLMSEDEDTVSAYLQDMKAFIKEQVL